MILKVDLASSGIALKDDASPEGRMLPGIVQSISVNGSARMEAGSAEGGPRVSGIMENKRVGITLLLVEGLKKTAYAQLGELEKIFQDASGGMPRVFTIKNEHLRGRQVHNMFFQSFTSTEGSGGEISVQLNFEEFTAAKDSKDSKPSSEASQSSETGQESGG